MHSVAQERLISDQGAMQSVLFMTITVSIQHILMLTFGTINQCTILLKYFKASMISWSIMAAEVISLPVQG